MTVEEVPNSTLLTRILETATIRPWVGPVWRCHGRTYDPADASGSLLATGRFHRARDRFPEEETWSALYTSQAVHVALGERLRHTTPASLAKLANQSISRIQLVLTAALVVCAESDCSRLCANEAPIERLCRPADYALTHLLALEARSVAEALVVPSCTQFPEGNVIVFPDRLQPTSSIAVVETRNPDLFIDWSNVTPQK